MSARRTRIREPKAAPRRPRPIPFKPQVVKPPQFLGLAPVFWVNVALAFLSLFVIVGYAGSVTFKTPEDDFNFQKYASNWENVAGEINRLVSESKRSKVDVSAIIDEIMKNQIPRACKRIASSIVFIEPVAEQIVDGELTEDPVTLSHSGFLFKPSGAADGDGYILTSFDAVNQVKWATVTFFDGQVTRAEVVGGDAASNIGVLKADMKLLEDPSRFRPAAIATEVSLGQPVITAGAAHTWRFVFYRGTISHLSRALEFSLRSGRIAGRYSAFYQVSSALNPGMDGGPALNSRGEVVGVNMTYLTKDDLKREFLVNYEYVKNINFVLPIGYALKVADEIVEKKGVTRSWIGVDFQIITEEGEPKLLISYVEPDSPAAAAGIRPGDVLEMIGPSPVSVRSKDDLPALRRTIASLKPGVAVALKIDRNGAEKTVSVKPEASSTTDEFEFFCSVWGLSLKPLTKREMNKRHIETGKGFIISYIDSGGRADEANLRVGDIVVGIEGQLPATREELRNLYVKLTGDKNLSTVFFKVIRSGFTRFFLVKNSRKLAGNR